MKGAQGSDETASLLQATRHAEVHKQCSPLQRLQRTPQLQSPHRRAPIHVCFAEADEDSSQDVLEILRSHGHDVTDCVRSPRPERTEMGEATILIEGAEWVLAVTSPRSVDSILLQVQLQWALDVAVRKGTSHVILLMPPEVKESPLSLLLEFFPVIVKEGDVWEAELLRLVASRPKPLSQSQRWHLEERLWVCGQQANLWLSQSATSLDRAHLQNPEDNRPLVPPSQWSRLSQRDRKQRMTSRDVALSSLLGRAAHRREEETGEISADTEEENEGGQADGEEASPLLETQDRAVHFLHTEEDAGWVDDVTTWLEERGVRCTDSQLALHPGNGELPQMEALITCAAWVVVMATPESQDSLTHDFLCQLAVREAARRRSKNVVVVFTHAELQGLAPGIISPFPRLIAEEEGDWRSKLMKLVTSLPPEFTQREVCDLQVHVDTQELLSHQGPLQGLWRAMSACSLEREPDTAEGSQKPKALLPLCLWLAIAGRWRKQHLGTAPNQTNWDTHSANSSDVTGDNFSFEEKVPAETQGDCVVITLSEENSPWSNVASEGRKEVPGMDWQPAYIPDIEANQGTGPGVEAGSFEVLVNTAVTWLLVTSHTHCLFLCVLPWFFAYLSYFYVVLGTVMTMAGSHAWALLIVGSFHALNGFIVNLQILVYAFSRAEHRHGMLGSIVPMRFFSRYTFGVVVSWLSCVSFSASVRIVIIHFSVSLLHQLVAVFTVYALIYLLCFAMQCAEKF